MIARIVDLILRGPLSWRTPCVLALVAAAACPSGAASAAGGGPVELPGPGPAESARASEGASAPESVTAPRAEADDVDVRSGETSSAASASAEGASRVDAAPAPAPAGERGDDADAPTRTGAADLPLAWLLDDTDEGAGGESEALSPGRLIARLVASAVAVSLTIIGALFLYRRRLRPSGHAAAAGWVQVVARHPISPRHAVCVLRLGERLVAVGLSGDRMTLLADLGEESAPPAARRPDSNSRFTGSDSSPAGLRSEGFGARTAGALGAGDEPESDRLRAALDTWRAALPDLGGRAGARGGTKG